MEKFLHVADLENRRRFSTWPSALRLQIHKAYLVVRAFAGPALILPLIFVPLLWPTRFRVLLSVLVMFAVGCLFHNFYTPHYAAPMTAAFFALVVAAWRCLWLQPRRWLAASAMVAILPYCLIASTAYTAVTATAGGRPFNTWENRFWPGNLERERVLRQLPPGRNHLLLVRYGPDHNCYEEWVHNLSDLDREPVIWARSLSPEEDAQLAEYYRDRQIWIIEPDQRPIRILPVSGRPAAFFQRSGKQETGRK